MTDGNTANGSAAQTPRVTNPRTLLPHGMDSSATRPGYATPSRRAVAAMNTDFSEIGVHDARKQGWGHGGPTDSRGRPESARLSQEKYGHLNAVFIGPNEKRVFLTFDEGYEKGFTPSRLDTLKDRGAAAVFFITLPYAQQHPELVRRMIDEGHTVGNHSAKHFSFPTVPHSEAARDIMELHEYIKTHFGYEMTLFRPPMGEFSEQTLALAQQLGYTSVFWSWAYKDWLVDDQPSAEEALHRITSSAHPGAVYLLHAVSRANTEALGDAIDKLREMGYEISAWDIS
jgi:peptidoglycan-N-acetylmuramic acid deacetylase